MPKLLPTPTPTASPLAGYHAKRDFAATSEPKGRTGRGRGACFVVQKHDARRLHYDLRLELDGVLKSWAVTRGPSLVPGEKRLAVHVEDHPLDYAGYEGVIPKGEYGAGSVIVWDRGTWCAEGDAHADYARGRLTFTLAGERLRGRWHLVRTKPRASKEQWLLLKADDEVARKAGDPDVLEQHVASVLSGRTNEEIATGGKLRTDHAGRARVATSRQGPAESLAAMPGARKGILPPFVEPCLATLTTQAPDGPGWLHEIKVDGYRVQARIDGPRVQLLTRSGLDWTERFASVRDALVGLAVPSALIDGEIVVEDARGVSRFCELQADLSAGRTDRMVFHAFDLLYVAGRDLRGAALRDRKAALAALLDDPKRDGRVRLAEHLEEDGAAMARHACRFGLEGIVAKRADRPYRSGRRGDWLKVKCSARQEFVVAGYLPSTVARGRVGSLVLGVHESGRAGRLVHVGRAGTGYTDAVARDLHARLEPLRRAASPFAGPLPAEAARGGVRWVEPRLVAEVELRGWTGEGQVRHAAFKGLREDKDAAAVMREGASTPPAGARSRAKAPAWRLTHPERVLWPDVGLTKQGLADYYASVADAILPHLVDRPLSLVRGPDGIAGPTFFQKHAWAGLDEKAVRRLTIAGEELLVIRDLAGLMALVQASVLEIHPWGSRLRTLEKPDRLVFDLDPGEGVGWSALVAAAEEIRDHLADIGLTGFAKTSGGKGLHVVVPLRPRATWAEAKAFAQRFAAALAADAPDRFVATMTKRVRRGRIFVDWLRNGRGATAVAAYSTRARPGAPVSVPVAWNELALMTGGDQFHVADLPARFDHPAHDPWPDFADAARTLPSRTER